MHLFYHPGLQPTDALGTLPDEDTHHAVKTLRLRVGESIAVTNGRGNRFVGVITKADAKQCVFRVERVETSPARPFTIRICVAPTKNMDRIEWFVEKAVELGIERISFFFRSTLRTAGVEDGTDRKNCSLGYEAVAAIVAAHAG